MNAIILNTSLTPLIQTFWPSHSAENVLGDAKEFVKKCAMDQKNGRDESVLRPFSI